eukprot:s1403_g33.t1
MWQWRSSTKCTTVDSAALVATDGYGWLRMATDGYGWLRMATDGYSFNPTMPGSHEHLRASQSIPEISLSDTVGLREVLKVLDVRCHDVKLM